MPFPAVVKATALGAAALTGAAGIAWSLTAGPTTPKAGVWVDGPLTGLAVEPGLVPVTAHASAADRVPRLVLLVDGTEVAHDDSLERRGLLSLGTFGWQAAEGKHALVVQAGDSRSDVVTVWVARRGATAAPTAAPQPTAAPTVSPTASPTASATPSRTPSPTPSPTRVVLPSATPPRTASPTPKPSPPVIGSNAFTPSSWYWDRRYSSDTACSPSLTQQSQATVTVTNATSVQVVVGGHAFAATRSGTTWTATVRSVDVPGTRTSRNVPVSIKAIGPGGTVSRDAGTVFIQSCEKD